MAACITCHVYRSDAEPRQPDIPPVCNGDRNLLCVHLGDLPQLHHRLASPEPAPSANSDGRGLDKLADLLPAGPVPGRNGSPRVTGSRNPPAPTPLDPIDLTLPLRGRATVHDPYGDQIGHLPAVAVLDAWVRDWRDTLFPDHHLPLPVVGVLSGWLADRLPVACGKHPAIDEFAGEIKHLRNSMRRVLGETDPQPETERYEGVSCRRCDLRGVLFRRPGDEYVECKHCGVLSTETELSGWAAREAGYERSLRTPEQITELLRHPTRRVAA